MNIVEQMSLKTLAKGSYRNTLDAGHEVYRFIHTYKLVLWELRENSQGFETSLGLTVRLFRKLLLTFSCSVCREQKAVQYLAPNWTFMYYLKAQGSLWRRGKIVRAKGGG